MNVGHDQRDDQRRGLAIPGNRAVLAGVAATLAYGLVRSLPLAGLVAIVVYLLATAAVRHR